MARGRKHNFGPRARGYQPRSTDRREPQTRFLIVCEGEQTERLYFAAFPVTSARVEVIGTGRNTLSLVQEATRIRDAYLVDGKVFDQVWAVFDRDSFRLEQFNQAFELAKKERVRVAFTNEAFELWYLLHFMYFDTGLSRSQYGVKLSARLGRKYQKNDPEMFDDLHPHMAAAIKNARRLAKVMPGRGNPSTTVHHLVEELLRWMPGFLITAKAVKKLKGK